MNAIFGSVGAGLLCGLLAYAAVRLAFPAVAVQEFGNLIGLAAVIGAGAGAWIARRHRAAVEARRDGDAPRK